MAANTTPAWPDLLQRVFEALAGGWYFLRPGRIVSYDSETQTATVQPMNTDPNGDGKALLPQVRNVPVIWPRVSIGTAGFAVIHLPMGEGSRVALLFADRSLEPWKKSGADYDPRDARMHDLNDCVALPGLYSANAPADVTGSDVQVILRDPEKGIDAQIKLDGTTGDVVLIPSSGKFVRTGSGAAAQAHVLGDLFLALFNSHTHPTPAGPSGIPAQPMTAAHLSTKGKVE